jgi:Fur family peroxide stress response transcriptional regulator
MRVSHHRVKVLHLLKTHKGHLSAKQVYDSIAPEIPSLSRTTVFNTLNALAQNGLIGAVMVPAGEMRYEYAPHEHCHFFCTECNEIIDTEFACGHRHALESQGHKVRSLHGCFSGVCRECLSKRGHA